jgi:uncharacterized DUF497 family protein
MDGPKISAKGHLTKHSAATSTVLLPLQRITGVGLGKKGLRQPDQPFVVRHDPGHSSDVERRWRALGLTDRDRHLFVVFTVRGDLIRVISARLMTRRERRFYAIHEEKET